MPWAELALRCGYYDQSHFANDFRAFSGINPTTYSAHRGPWQNHVPILSSDSSEFSKHNDAFGDRMTDMTTSSEELQINRNPRAPLSKCYGNDRMAVPGLRV